MDVDLAILWAQHILYWVDEGLVVVINGLLGVHVNFCMIRRFRRQKSFCFVFCGENEKKNIDFCALERTEYRFISKFVRQRISKIERK